MMGQTSKRIYVCCPALKPAALMFAFSLLVQSSALGAGESLDVKVIHATRVGTTVDPELRTLVGDFERLKFTSYKVLDRASIKLTTGSNSRFQLPNGLWVEVGLREISESGVWRILIRAKKLKFKSVVAINPGGTVAVGGPPFKNGALIFALSREKKR